MGLLARELGVEEDLVSVSDPWIYDYFLYEEGSKPANIFNNLKSAKDFWKDTLHADPEVIDIIESGYKIPFIQIPPNFKRKNNASAKKHNTFVTKAIKDLLETKVVMEVKETPKIISPLSVAENSSKLRLILDLSILNNFVKTEKFTLEDSVTFFEFAKTGNYAIAFDIKSAYHQIPLHEDHYTYTGFSWLIDGKEKYFVFKVLPFGITTGPIVCKKMFRPLICKWRKSGILCVIFFDDGAMCASDYKTCVKQSMVMKSDLLRAHILPNCEKSDWSPSKSLLWLGLAWDFNAKGVRISQVRVEKFLQICLTLKNAWPNVSARQVAKLVGSLVSMNLVLQDKAIFYSRFLQHMVNQREILNLSWDSKLDLSKFSFNNEALADLDFLRLNFESLNFRSFLMPPNRDYIRIFGDASNKGLGGFLELDGQKFPFVKSLTAEEKKKSSTFRELLAINFAVESFQQLIQKKNLLYVTDSQTTEVIMRKGSMRIELHNLARKITKSINHCDSVLNVAWVPRLHNSIADMYSNFCDYDDWAITTDLYQKIRIITKFDFDLDVFANNLNKKCEKFYSRFYFQGTSGVNSLVLPWEGIIWAVPPPRLAVRAIQYFVVNRCKGVIIVPRWEGQGFWGLLMSDYMCTFIKRVIDFPGYKYVVPGTSGNSVFNNFNGILSVFVLDCK